MEATGEETALKANDVLNGLLIQSISSRPYRILVYASYGIYVDV